MDITVRVLRTDLVPNLVEQLEWNFMLASYAHDIAEAAEKLTSIPAHYVREVMSFEDPIEKEIIIEILPEMLPPFVATFTVLGEHNGFLWGTLDTYSPVARSVNQRFKRMDVIEDDGVLAMVNHEDFSHVAVLLRERDRVDLKVGFMRGDLLGSDPELDILESLISQEL